MRTISLCILGSLFCCLLTQPLVFADDSPDVMERMDRLEKENAQLLERIRQLERENRQLRSNQTSDTADSPVQDAPAKIPLEKPKPKEKSLATLAGWEPNQKPFIKKGRLSFNYYYDSRNFNNLTVNSSAKLPADFSYYQLLTLSSSLDSSPRKRWDFTKFYTEINLRRPIMKEHELLKALDWTVQYVDGTFVKQRTRFGSRVRFHNLSGPIGDFLRDTLKLKYTIGFHAYETDGDGWQLEHVYRREFMDGLFYISGFTDQTFDEDRGQWFISETQLGIRVIDNFYFINELRYNATNPDGKRWGLGTGLEYVVRF